MCVHTCARSCVCMCMCRAEVDAGYLPQLLPTLFFFETRSLPKPRLHHLGLTVARKPQGTACLHLPRAGVASECTYTCSPCGFWRLDTGPHAHMAGTSLTPPSPRSLFSICFQILCISPEKQNGHPSKACVEVRHMHRDLRGTAVCGSWVMGRASDADFGLLSVSDAVDLAHETESETSKDDRARTAAVV